MRRWKKMGAGIIIGIAATLVVWAIVEVWG